MTDTMNDFKNVVVIIDNVDTSTRTLEPAKVGIFFLARRLASYSVIGLIKSSYYNMTYSFIIPHHKCKGDVDILNKIVERQFESERFNADSFFKKGY